MTPAEVRALLNELDRRMGSEIGRFWRSAATRLPSDEFRDAVVKAFPEIVTPYTAAGADIGAAAYDSQPSLNQTFRAAPADPPPAAKLEKSAEWALATGNGDAAIQLLTGAATRALFDSLRETIWDNAAAEPGARWARHASANACGFCRMLVTRHVGPNATFYDTEQSATRVVGRSPSLTLADRRSIAAGLMTREQAMASRKFYSSWRQAARAGKRVGDLKERRTRGSRELGEKFHDNCHCTAVAVRPGQVYEPPAYVEQWNEDYMDAVGKAYDEGLTLGRYQAINPKVIARLMDPH